MPMTKNCASTSSSSRSRPTTSSRRTRSAPGAGSTSPARQRLCHERVLGFPRRPRKLRLGRPRQGNARRLGRRQERRRPAQHAALGGGVPDADRKSTRLNSSHVKISYAVFCLKKKKTDYAVDTSGLGDTDTR